MKRDRPAVAPLHSGAVPGVASHAGSAIPFNKPFVSGKEYDYIREAIANGHISGDGSFTRRCQAILEETLGCRKALLTTSCSDALELSALLLDLQPGDEFIVPSFTFVSTANAFALRGAVPRFVDIRSDTLNLDENRIAELISGKTRLIVPVHYAGVGCEMDRILEVADRRGLAVVEDNAHGLFGRYRGRNLGTFGQLATLSFHETKNISCGEGGALLINNPEFTDRAEVLREKGTNRSRFFRGLVDKYSWVDLGSSFLPSDLLAAFLFAQLEAREAIQTARERIWYRYRAGLAPWAAPAGVRTPFVPPHCDQTYHIFYLILPSGQARDALIAHLKSRAIHSVFHYLPLHLSVMGRKAPKADCPVTVDISDRLVRLPFYNGLSPADQDRVIEAILCFQP